MTTTVRRLYPADLPRSPVFSPGVSVETSEVRTVYVGGQNGLGADRIVPDDVAEQTRLALHNVRVVLIEAGAEPQHVISWTILLAQQASLEDAFGAFADFWTDAGEPPTVSVSRVVGLANPAFLIEISAIAIVPLG
ncbi:MAG TPA: RidA family protein [Frankiaceae bacterium]|nr:RidA family protein [Frankiaceae bacterium]